MTEYRLSCDVDAYRSGWTLESFLAHRFRYHPVEIWRDRIDAGTVRVNGVVARADTVVRKGDRVGYSFEHTEPVVDFRFDVLFEDDGVLAVSKSGNLPVHAGGKFISHTLIARLRERWGAELRPAHRLDRETSGVVLLAKTKEVARELEVEFRERRVEKEYLAIVRGELPEEVVVDAPIARREPAEPPYFRVVDPGRGRPARTRLVPVAVRRRGEPLTLVRAVPQGGRTNQIRVHARHAGHSILGDKIYGVPEDVAREFVRDGETDRVLAAAGAPRHLLHCTSLTLRHPLTGDRMRLAAPLLPDFAAAWGAEFPGEGGAPPEEGEKSRRNRGIL